MSPEIMASAREGSGSASAVAKSALSSTTKTLMKLLSSAAVVASEAVAQVRGMPPSTAALSVSRSAEDSSFSELDGYLTAQAPMLVALYNAAAGLAGRYREEAALLRDFGTALRQLGECEGSSGQGSVGAGLDTVGAAVYASAIAAYEQASCHTEAMVETLADYVRGNRAAREALDARTAACAAMLGAAGDVDRAREALGRVPPSGPAAPQQRAAAEAEVAGALARAAEARAFYNRAAEGLLGDVERSREALRVDLRTVLLDFTAAQLRTEKKLQAAWGSTRQHPNLPSPQLLLGGGGGSGSGGAGGAAGGSGSMEGSGGLGGI